MFLSQRKNMNSKKHVILEEVFTSVNVLSKIFERKNKSEYNSVLPKFASVFGLVEHVRHHQIFISDFKDTGTIFK
jgi:hypothetical protein